MIVLRMLPSEKYSVTRAKLTIISAERIQQPVGERRSAGCDTVGKYSSV